MPRLTLTRKLFLALATLLLTLLVAFAVSSMLSLRSGLGPYVAEIEIRRLSWLAERLQQHYVANGNWSRLRGNEEAWNRLQRGEVDPASLAPRERPTSFWDRPSRGGGWTLPFGEDREPPSPLEPGGRTAPPWFFPFPRGEGGPPDLIFKRLAVVDTAGKLVVGAKVDPATAAHLPIRSGTVIIGQLLLAPMQGLEHEADRAFLARHSGFIALAGAVGLVAALLIAGLVGRRWLAPIDDLTHAARAVARGRLGTRVRVQGQDELALLGRTFNTMADRLDKAEAGRRAWLADVAHELRTPLAAMRAEIEAIQDGVRSFDDRTALRLHRQVMRLTQLVDDLRHSMDSHGTTLREHAPTYPLTLLQEALAATRDRFAQAGIAVEADSVGRLAEERAPRVLGEARKLSQVWINLLENTLLYTDAGGRLAIEARIDRVDGGPALVVQLDDSAPGVTEDELPRLFDRLFRAEASRNRALGGSGLGLAICRAIVDAHGGDIEAGASPLGGLRITLFLPISDTEPS
ncbi:ATP-binding protein [uncultured Pseudacidovorax sp.]|uniref:ATP-binding protein n=1 Tax=uncultured Pseudacidovorax sp. TaxID=679313 RepID=UPI0025DB6517|nr:ATP-binding protein [uncultured Pseudacidovorax sp.]